MLNYLKKFAMEILPSVAATIIGAYIVNHYINTKPAEAPTAAVVSKAQPKATKPASAETAAIPEPGIKAKGISEKAMIEKTASEHPAEVNPAEAKADSKPVETASAPADTRRHPILPLAREKAAAEKPKASPSPAAIAITPAATTPVTPAPAASPPPSAEASATPAEEHRDAAELARAAIERLRGLADKGSEKPQDKGQEKVQEAVRSPESPRMEAPRVEAPRVEAQRVQEPLRSVASVPVRPLPPPITVSARPVEQGASPQPPYPPNTASVSGDDPSRPTPPADIPPPPAQPPLDLRADAAAASPRDHARNVAEDMLSAAKSMFHAVIPSPSSSSSKFTD
jgi:hypothetical protein